MRSGSYIILLLLALFIAACEQTVEPVDIPFVERIVVSGVVVSGQGITVHLSRTIPVNHLYDPDEAAISDSSAVVTVQSSSGTVRLHPVVVSGNRVPGYFGDSTLIVQSGETYTLTVEWKGKRVTATTTVPFEVPIESVELIAQTTEWGDIDSVLEVTFTPRGDQVYAVTQAETRGRWEEDTLSFHFEDDLYYSERIARRRDTSEDGRIRMRTRFGINSYSPDRADTLYAVLYTFDPQFYDYYHTYQNSNDFNGPFSAGGETVAWNIQGDGLGMFIGRARSERRVRP